MCRDDISDQINKIETENPTMNIRSIPGTEVVFKYPENGTDFDGQWAKKILKVGEKYTIQSVEVGQSMSLVEFKEFPELQFNTVHFANI